MLPAPRRRRARKGAGAAAYTGCLLPLPLKRQSRSIVAGFFAGSASCIAKLSFQNKSAANHLDCTCGRFSRRGGSIFGPITWKGARQSSTATQLAASERHNKNEAGTFLTAGGRKADMDRAAGRNARRHSSARSRVPCPLSAAPSDILRRGKAGRACVGGPWGAKYAKHVGWPRWQEMAQHSKTMEQPMLKHLHPLSVPRSGGLELRRGREHWKRGQRSSGSGGTRMGEWCDVLLWRLKPSHPPSIL